MSITDWKCENLSIGIAINPKHKVAFYISLQLPKHNVSTLQELSKPIKKYIDKSHWISQFRQFLFSSSLRGMH